MFPKVIIHIAASLDGRITGFFPDLELYYTLAGSWNPDAVLISSATILGAPTLEVPKEHDEIFCPKPGTLSDPRPLGIIVDSRGRISTWDQILRWPYFRRYLVLCSDSTPESYLRYLKSRDIETIISGGPHVGFPEVMERLYREDGVRVVRVDSGGTLNSVLLRDGLVHEVSVLIHPVIAGGISHPTLCDPLQAGISDVSVSLRLVKTEVLRRGIIWARYLIKYPDKNRMREESRDGSSLG